MTALFSEQMEIQLSNHIETTEYHEYKSPKTDDKKPPITIEKLHNLHNKSLNTNLKIKPQNIKQYVDTLGGMHIILSHYINLSMTANTNTPTTEEDNTNNLHTNDTKITQNIQLTQDQITKLHHLLSKEDAIMKSTDNSEINLNVKPQPKEFTYHWSTSDTIFHKLLSFENANKLMDSIYNTWFVAIMAISSLIFLITDALGPVNKQWTWFLVYRSILFPVYNIWLLFICFTVNRFSFALIMKSFEYAVY